MFSLKEIKEITKGRIVNGDENTVFKGYSVRKNNHKAGMFFIPIVFRGNREEFIMDAVTAGASGFMIDKNSKVKEEMVAKAKEINPEIAIVEVERVNEAITFTNNFI